MTVAKVIRIDNTTKTLTIDGEVFPWVLAEDGPACLHENVEDMPVVAIPVLVDRVEVVDENGGETVHEFLYAVEA